VLRAGTERGWGVAVVCGAGINCVGVAPDGRCARFPALGAITGDWGGGYDVGLAALSAAARSADGRGPRTALEPAVGAHFGLPGAAAVGEAIHERRLPGRRLVELAPLVLGLAGEDAVAAEISERLAHEVVAFARVALERLGLQDDAVDVVLGGGLLRAEHAHLAAGIERRLAAVAPRAAIRLTGDPPIVGAALLALDAAGARAANGGAGRAAADARLRAELGAAVRDAEAERTARLAAAGAPVAEARMEAEVGLGLGLGLGGLGSGGGQDGG
jgi:N-acetylglucosamine kinase-like BadF-type ATPase